MVCLSELQKDGAQLSAQSLVSFMCVTHHTLYSATAYYLPLFILVPQCMLCIPSPCKPNGQLKEYMVINYVMALSLRWFASGMCRRKKIRNAF